MTHPNSQQLVKYTFILQICKFMSESCFSNNIAFIVRRKDYEILFISKYKAFIIFISALCAELLIDMA